MTMKIEKLIGQNVKRQRCPAATSLKKLPVLIAFSDYPHSNSASSINSKLFGSGSEG